MAGGSDVRRGDATLRLSPLEVEEDLPEVACGIEARSPRPVDDRRRGQEHRLRQPIHRVELLTPEPADPLPREPPAHHLLIEPLGRHPVLIEPALLSDIGRVLQGELAASEQPDIQVDIPGDRS